MWNPPESFNLGSKWDFGFCPSQQSRKAAPKQVQPLFIDCEPEKPHWGWSWLERWMAARPWENRIFENNSVSKDVFDGHSNKSADGYSPGKGTESETDLKQQNAYARRKNLVPPLGPLRSGETWSASKGLQLVPLSDPVASIGNGPLHPNPMSKHGTSSQGQKPAFPTYKQLRPASPRRRVLREDLDDAATTVSNTARSTSSMPVANPRFGTRYSNSGPVRDGSIQDNESLASCPAVPSYMLATHNSRNKTRSHSQPRQRPGTQRPGTPDKESASTTKRLSYPITKDVIRNSEPTMRSSKPSTYTQKIPSLQGAPEPSRNGWSPVSSHGANDSTLHEETPQLNGHSASNPGYIY